MTACVGTQHEEFTSGNNEGQICKAEDRLEPGNVMTKLQGLETEDFPSRSHMTSMQSWDIRFALRIITSNLSLQV